VTGAPKDPEIELTLDAVIAAVTEQRPRILTVTNGEGHGSTIPSGPVSRDDATLERAIRRWIFEQAGIEVGYVEQLYTFGDLHRGMPGGPGARAVSIAYLALVREEQPAPDAAWIDWYELLPWEDHRDGRPRMLDDWLLPALLEWAGGDEQRMARVGTAFGGDAGHWDGIRVLERYELLYEAELVAETGEGHSSDPHRGGRPMAFDHRRIAATALGRLRGKLTYRPVVFELLPDTFTLLTLQRTVEALAGVELHKQNFRRLVERSRLVEGTGRRAPATSGRPAELFRFRPEVLLERPRPGVGVPYR
jgi:hypothetical protein